LLPFLTAPAGAEIRCLFRGFLFRGWHRLPRDAWVAIIVTALLWALSHAGALPAILQFFCKARYGARSRRAFKKAQEEPTTGNLFGPKIA
jgi:hypothetical protein